MARKPLTQPQILDPDVDQQRIDGAMEALREAETSQLVAASQHDAAVRAVAAQLGYMLPADCCDPDLIQRDISANIRRSVEACLEVGRGLCVLKEACEHGNFMARLDVLGIEQSVARRFMQAATKFSKRAAPHVLAAAGNQSKLFELLILDDEQLDELELTGQTGNLKLDDIDFMSQKELRVALREARADNDAKDERLKLRAEKNEELEAQLQRMQRQPADEVYREVAEETAGLVAEAQGLIRGNLRNAFATLRDQAETAGVGYRDLLAGHVGELKRMLLELSEEFALPDHVGDGTPEWMRADDAAGNKAA